MSKFKAFIIQSLIIGVSLILSINLNDIDFMTIGGLCVFLAGGFFFLVKFAFVRSVCRSTCLNDNQKSVDRNSINYSKRFEPNDTPQKHELSENQIKKSSPHGQSSRSTSKSTRTQILGILYVIVYLVLLFGGVILFSMNKVIAGGIVFGSSFLWIIVPILISQIASRRHKKHNTDKFFATGKVVFCDRIPTAQSDINLYRLTVEVERNTYSKIVNKRYIPDDLLPMYVHDKSGCFDLLDEHSLTLGPSDQARFDSIAYAAEHPPTSKRDILSNFDTPMFDNSVVAKPDPLIDCLTDKHKRHLESSESNDDAPVIVAEYNIKARSTYDDVTQYSKQIDMKKTNENISAPLPNKSNDRRTPPSARPNIAYKEIKRKK